MHSEWNNNERVAEVGRLHQARQLLLRLVVEGQQYCTENSAGCFESILLLRRRLKQPKPQAASQAGRIERSALKATAHMSMRREATTAGYDRRDAKAKPVTDESPIGKLT